MGARYTGPVQYAAFLRAINVGRANRVRMETLRAMCASLGFADPVTYLQSGNFVFGADEPPDSAALRLEEALAASGLKNVAAMVRTREELAGVVAACPFDEFDPALFRCFVTFLRQPLPRGLAAAMPLSAGVLAVREREVLTVTKIAETPGLDVNGLLARAANLPATTRYWSVARGVLDLMEAQPRH
jgi:uncharacterized protein (DUF1697 family)